MNKQVSFDLKNYCRAQLKTIHNISTSQKFKDIQYNRSRGMIEHLAKCFKLQHFKEKAKLNDEIVTNYNLSKENYGMFIEAYKVENRLEVKKKQESINVNRITSMHSKTFKIRTNKNKYNSNTFNKTILSSPKDCLQVKKQISLTFHNILPQTVRSSVLKNICQKTTFYKRILDKKKESSWSMMIPAYYFLKNYEKIKFKLYDVFLEGIQLFVKAHSQEQKNSVIDLCEFVNIIRTSRNTIVQSQVFIDIQQIPHISDNIIMMNMSRDYPIWYAYQQSQRNYIYIKNGLHNTHIINNLQINKQTIQLSSSLSKIQTQYTFNNDKLQAKIRYLNKTRISKNGKRQKQRQRQKDKKRKMVDVSYKNLDSLLQQFINCQISNNSCDSNRKIIEKEKTPTQLMYQLTRNNKMINKQIQNYYHENRGLQLGSDQEEVDKLYITHHILQ